MDDNEPMDGKSDVVLNFDKEDLYNLMLLAHERDITLNQLIEDSLRVKIAQWEREAQLVKDLQDLP